MSETAVSRYMYLKLVRVCNVYYLILISFSIVLVLFVNSLVFSALFSNLSLVQTSAGAASSRILI